MIFAQEVSRAWAERLAPLGFWIGRVRLLHDERFCIALTKESAEQWCRWVEKPGMNQGPV